MDEKSDKTIKADAANTDAAEAVEIEAAGIEAEGMKAAETDPVVPNPAIAERERRISEKLARSAERKAKRRVNIVWIIFVFIAAVIGGESLLYPLYDLFFNSIKHKVSDGMAFTLEMYTATIVSVICIFVLCWSIKENRYIWKSFLPPKRGSSAEISDDLLADFYGRRRNTWSMLVKGLLLGFLTNFFCIGLALLHGDIKLYFDCSMSQIPLFIFALVSVWIQSSSEEMWSRGFLYERLHEKYPLWMAVAVNGILFGLLHVFNDSVTVLSIVSIIVTGISYSLLRWYTGNIWIAMGIHTGWNFTQNYLFGLPNSGLISQCSVFHLDAATGARNLIYDYGFGVEGALPAVFMDAMVGAVCLVLAYRSGRIGELKMSRRQMLEHGASRNTAI